MQTVVEDTPTTIVLIGESDLGEPTQAIVTQPPDPSAGQLYHRQRAVVTHHGGTALRS
jgi:hypothetical protein